MYGCNSTYLLMNIQVYTMHNFCWNYTSSQLFSTRVVSPLNVGDFLLSVLIYRLLHEKLLDD